MLFTMTHEQGVHSRRTLVFHNPSSLASMPSALTPSHLLPGAGASTFASDAMLVPTLGDKPVTHARSTAVRLNRGARRGRFAADQPRHVVAVCARQGVPPSLGRVVHAKLPSRKSREALCTPRHQPERRRPGLALLRTVDAGADNANVPAW